MARILKNKTAADVEVNYGTTTVVVEANSQRDLSATFEAWQLAASVSLIELLGQGVEKYQLNDGTNDLSVADAIDLIRGYRPAEIVVAGPKMSDGSPYSAPCMFPSGVFLYITGAGDGDAPGNGPAFSMASEAAGDTTLEFSYLDWVLASGGAANPVGGLQGDWASFEVYCPSTPVVPNAGGTGNCNVVQGVIVPAAGDGAYDVDLDDANPVLVPTHDGYWEWSFPPTGKGVVTVGVPGKAGAHLIAADVPLVRFANRIPLLGSNERNFTIPAIEPKIILPHWKSKVTLHNGGHTGLKMDWHLLLARIRTV